MVIIGLVDILGYLIYSMKNKNIIIISASAFLLSINFILFPYLHRREATHIVESVIKSWEANDLSYAFNAWENMQKSPPIYDLVSGEITKRIFDRKNGVRHALIYARLEFHDNSTLPSGKEWVFELSRTRLGWKVINFYMAKDQPE